MTSVKDIISVLSDGWRLLMLKHVTGRSLTPLLPSLTPARDIANPQFRTVTVKRFYVADLEDCIALQAVLKLGRCNLNVFLIRRSSADGLDQHSTWGDAQSAPEWQMIREEIFDTWQGGAIEITVPFDALYNPTHPDRNTPPKRRYSIDFLPGANEWLHRLANAHAWVTEIRKDKFVARKLDVAGNAFRLSFKAELQHLAPNFSCSILKTKLSPRRQWLSGEWLARSGVRKLDLTVDSFDPSLDLNAVSFAVKLHELRLDMQIDKPENLGDRLARHWPARRSLSGCRLKLMTGTSTLVTPETCHADARCRHAGNHLECLHGAERKNTAS